MPWSYQDDIKLLKNKDKTAIKLQEIFPDKSTKQLRLRKNALKNTTIEKLQEDELFLIANFAKLNVDELAACVKTTYGMMCRRIAALKREGKLPQEKPNLLLSKEDRQAMVEEIAGVKYKPMPRTMPRVMQPVKPEKAFSKGEIQRDILEVNKEYLVNKKGKGSKVKKMKLKVIGAYKDYYLLEDNTGRKYSLLKVDYHLGEWWVS